MRHCPTLVVTHMESLKTLFKFSILTHPSLALHTDAQYNYKTHQVLIQKRLTDDPVLGHGHLYNLTSQWRACIYVLSAGHKMSLPLTE